MIYNVAFKGVRMATSSITKNFYLSGKEAEAFADAVELSFQERKPPAQINVNKVQSREELQKLMMKRNRVNGG